MDLILWRHAEAHELAEGQTDLDRALTVTAHRFSASARQKIEAAGGACHAIEHDSGAA